jgi:hypothetical protein
MSFSAPSQDRRLGGGLAMGFLSGLPLEDPFPPSAGVADPAAAHESGELPAQESHSRNHGTVATAAGKEYQAQRHFG